MKSSSCLDAGCEFSSGTKGVLSASEINKIIKNGGKMKLDEAAAIQIVTWTRTSGFLGMIPRRSRRSLTTPMRIDLEGKLLSCSLTGNILD